MSIYMSSLFPGPQTFLSPVLKHTRITESGLVDQKLHSPFSNVKQMKSTEVQTLGTL